MREPPRVSPPSSRPRPPVVNDRPDGSESAYIHKKTIRGFLTLERRVLDVPSSADRPKRGPKRGPKPLEKPRRADEILARLAARHRPGEALGLVQIAAAGGCSTGSANAIRRWAREAGLWPYAQSKGGFPARRAGGEP